MCNCRFIRRYLCIYPCIYFFFFFWLLWVLRCSTTFWFLVVFNINSIFHCVKNFTFFFLISTFYTCCCISVHMCVFFPLRHTATMLWWSCLLTSWGRSVIQQCTQSCQPWLCSTPCTASRRTRETFYRSDQFLSSKRHLWKKILKILPNVFGNGF